MSVIRIFAMQYDDARSRSEINELHGRFKQVEHSIGGEDLGYIIALAFPRVNRDHRLVSVDGCVDCDGVDVLGFSVKEHMGVLHLIPVVPGTADFLLSIHWSP